MPFVFFYFNRIWTAEKGIPNIMATVLYLPIKDRFHTHTCPADGPYDEELLFGQENKQDPVIPATETLKVHG